MSKNIKLKKLIKEDNNHTINNKNSHINTEYKFKNISKECINEDLAFEKNYLPNQIKNFVSKADTTSPYKPQIKLHWSDDNTEANTKWLAITWDMIDKLIDITSGDK